MSQSTAGFIDPRSKPRPASGRGGAWTTTDHDDLADLHRLCREGRLYDVEDWVRAGRPLQLGEATFTRGRRPDTALEIALEAGNQALVLLLLSNGYDTNREPDCPLDTALRARRWDLLDLLLDWGADPHRLNPEDLFGTYDSRLFERFRLLGVDLTACHALADALALHTSNKPLFGFARRHRDGDPRVQRELNMALGHHVWEGNEKGLQLCLWAGADPHAPAPSLRWSREEDDEDEEEGTDDEDRYIGSSAIDDACLCGHVAILERLGPDPALDDYDHLFSVAHDEYIIAVLARKALPTSLGGLMHRYMWWLSGNLDRWGSEGYRALSKVRKLFNLGLRWDTSTADTTGAVRHALLRASDYMFVDAMKLLAEADHCAPDILKELARTPAMRARMKKVGFIPPSPNERDEAYRPRPTRSREVLSKFGVELPKPPKYEPTQPRVVQIGAWRPNARQVRMTRAQLFEEIWSKPAVKLAEEWGLSGRGLAKACGRLKVPVPPRGYWARLEAGQRVHRPRLPALPSGQAEEVIV